MLSVDPLLKESERIEPVPQVVHQLMDLADDLDAPVSEITDLILYEPVVTANLLKLANSAAFGLKKRIDSVFDAVVMLGLKRVVDIVLMSSVTPSLRSAQKGYGLEDGQLWKQSVSCALIAGEIAEAVDPLIRHTVFTATLLKDIGVMVMDRHLSASDPDLRERVLEANLDLVEAERQVLGVDHAFLGGRMAENWNFGPALTDAIRRHHLSGPEPTVSRETAMVYLADCMCSLSGINAELFCGKYRHYDGLMAKLQLSEATVNRIMSDFFSRKENIYGLLAIL